MLKEFLPKKFSHVVSFFKDLITNSPTHSRIFFVTTFLCFLPALLSLLGFDFGIKYNIQHLNLLEKLKQEDEIFKIIDKIEKGNFLHTILETVCVIIAIFTVVFAFIIYEVKKDTITVVIAITLFCAGILDAFHILASDQLIWSPGQKDVTAFTWLISRIFNSGIILFSSIIILSNYNLFNRIAERSVYQLAFFFILITLLTTIIVFFNVNHLPHVILYRGMVSRPLELFPLVIFLINLFLILPVFYKRNPSIFSFALLISMIPAAATQLYMAFSSQRFDSNFNSSHMIKGLSYLLPFVGILIDYLHTYQHQNSLIDQLNNETKEKTKAETLLKGVLDSSIDGIVALSSVKNQQNDIVDFKITLVNDAVETLTGIPKKDLLGSNFLSKDLLSDGELFKLYISVAEKGGSLSFERLFHTQNKSIWFSIVAVKLRDGLAITFKDVTSIKKAHEDIIHYQKELEYKVEELNRSNTELEQFAYIASHDLQEPLRKIQAFGDRLSTKYSNSLEDEGKDYISRMKNAAVRMQVLINDLLNFSRVKRTNNKFEKISLTQLVQEVLEDLEASINSSRAKIHLQELPEIEGDRRQLGQLFQNLISNGLKFIKKDIVPEINISFKRLNKETLKEKYNIDSPGQYLEIEVKDNGIGFDNKYLDKIFTIFQRLHGRTEYEGTGIGLAICRKVVENHNGSITANSQPNNGTSFYIVIPEKQG